MGIIKKDEAEHNMLIEGVRCNNMAVVKNNPVLEGASGMLGKTLVYRQMNGKTIVQCAPVRTAPYNAAQKKQQGRFKEAMAYARKLLADPEVQAAYTLRAKAKGWHWNAFNLAVSEWLKGEVHGSLFTDDSTKFNGKNASQNGSGGVQGRQLRVRADSRKNGRYKNKDIPRPIEGRLFVNAYGELSGMLNEPVPGSRWDSS